MVHPRRQLCLLSFPENKLILPTSLSLALQGPHITCPTCCGHFPQAVPSTPLLCVSFMVFIVLLIAAQAHRSAVPCRTMLLHGRIPLNWEGWGHKRARAWLYHVTNIGFFSQHCGEWDPPNGGKSEMN